MEGVDPKPTETVSESKAKKTRKFTWTDKRKAQFEKMLSNKKSEKRSETCDKSKEEPKVEVVEDPESLKQIKEEKQSENIVKRMMDPHFLARKHRHMVGTTSDVSSSESESDDSSDSEESTQSEYIPKKKPPPTKKDWKLKRKIVKLRTKNKQLQDLFLSKSKKRYKSKNIFDSEESEEESNYSSVPVPVKPPPSLYFC
jgi:hypothetical protein